MRQKKLKQRTTKRCVCGHGKTLHGKKGFVVHSGACKVEGCDCKEHKLIKAGIKYKDEM